MSKFKVGDKAEFTEAFGDYLKGEVVEITGVGNEVTFPSVDYKGEKSDGWVHQRRLKKVESKPTKNQRITSLEETVEQQQNEINELKVIVHQLRNEPKIIFESVEEIIEFEGAKYRKVTRKAQAGDVVVLRDTGGDLFKVGNAYKVVDDIQMADEDGDLWDVYRDRIRRTPETVDVYELIVEDKQFPPSVIPELVKTANELRAEIIEKAKSFIQHHEDENWEFAIAEEFNRVFAFNLKLKDNDFGFYQDASKIFNEHIGKAVALGRALNLDVSEFEQAVQPNRRVDGMVMEWRGKKRVIAVPYIDGETCDFDSEIARYGTIINDTNAIYGGVE